MTRCEFTGDVMMMSRHCRLQIWDLSAGKVITDFKSHTGAVTSVQFHPKEFLLASASFDRTTKFWDLERFTLVSETAPEANGIRCIRFHPEGEAIFSGAQDSLRVREGKEEKEGGRDSFSPMKDTGMRL